jgi:CheY-like chemotaxis protein
MPHLRRSAAGVRCTSMARVMVVDADRDFRESARLLLAAAGHEVYERGQLRMALSLIEALPGAWHVIVDGEVTAVGVRTTSRLRRRGVRVIVIEKPIEPSRLIAFVDGGTVVAPAGAGDSGPVH